MKMKLAKRENNEIIVSETEINIIDIDKLHNAQLVQIEKGDSILNLIEKKAPRAFGKIRLHSVKVLKESMQAQAEKARKKHKQDGGWCMVCVEEWTKNSSGICNHCAL